MRYHLLLAILLAVFLCLFIPSNSSAVSFAFQKIVEAGDPVPDMPGETFGQFGFRKLFLDSGNFAFLGFGSLGVQAGIYVHRGSGIEKVADINTAVPGGGATFQNFRYPSISDSNVVYVGLWDVYKALFTDDGAGDPALIADNNTLMPGGGTLKNIGEPVVSTGIVAFHGEVDFGLADYTGIYTLADGVISTIAEPDQTTIPGGSGAFTALDLYPAISDGNVVFIGIGENSQKGIYLYSGGSITRVADRNTSIPGGSGMFTDFGIPDISGTDVAFGADGAIFVYSGGSLSRIVDTETAIPDVTGTSFGFNDPVIYGGNLAFRGFVDGSPYKPGIFAVIDGELMAVARNGDIIDGDTLTGFYAQVDISGDQIAFGAFAGGKDALYIATIVYNTAPTIEGTPPASVNEDTAYSFLPTAADIDEGDTLTFSVANLPSWAGFDPVTGALTGTPENGDVGVYEGIVITVADAAGEENSLPSFSIAVHNVNDAPVIGGTPPETALEGAAYSFTPTASDPDIGDDLTFSVANPPAWCDFDTNTGTLSGTPERGDLGTTTGIVISVTDGKETAALPSFDLTAAGSAKIDAAVAIDFAGHDALSVRNATVSLEGTGFSTVTGLDGGFTLEGIPSGTYTLTVSAPDMKAFTTEVTLSAGETLTPDPIQMTAGAFTQADIDQAVADEQARWDANGDGQKGLEEAVEALQIVSGVRVP